MTAFTTTDLPAEINTVEKLAAWALTILTDINANVNVSEEDFLYNSDGQIEAKPRIERAVQIYEFRVGTSSPPKSRRVFRVSFSLNDNYLRGNKPWLMVDEFSTSTIPTEYKS